MITNFNLKKRSKIKIEILLLIFLHYLTMKKLNGNKYEILHIIQYIKYYELYLYILSISNYLTTSPIPLFLSYSSLFLYSLFLNKLVNLAADRSFLNLYRCFLLCY